MKKSRLILFLFASIFLICIIAHFSRIHQPNVILTDDESLELNSSTEKSLEETYEDFLTENNMNEQYDLSTPYNLEKINKSEGIINELSNAYMKYGIVGSDIGDYMAYIYLSYDNQSAILVKENKDMSFNVIKLIYTPDHLSDASSWKVVE